MIQLVQFDEMVYAHPKLAEILKFSQLFVGKNANLQYLKIFMQIWMHDFLWPLFLQMVYHR